jgi:hypothetical protein
MMLDRTISMFSDPQSVPDEQVAAESLLDIYGALATPPLVGVGRFGKDSGVSAEIIPGTTNGGSLRSYYGSRVSVSSLGSKYPTGTTTPSTWSNSQYALASSNNDGLYSTSNTSGQKQIFTKFGFSTSTIPANATRISVAVTVDAKVTASPQSGSATIYPNAAGNYNPPSQWSTDQGVYTTSKKVAAVNDSSDSTYIATNVSGSAQTFMVDTSSIPSGATISSVILSVRAKKSGSGSSQIALRIEKGTGAGMQNDTTTTTLSSTSFGVVNTATLTKDPFTNTTWTIAELGSWGFGVVKTNSSGTVRASQIYLTVNYTYTPIPSGSLKVNLSYNNGGAWAATTQTASLTGTETAYTLGSNSDDWGRTWSPADFGNGFFVLQLTNNSSAGMTVMVDDVSVQVYYTGPSTGLYSAIDTGLNDVNSMTNIGDAINAGVAELNRINDGKSKVLILISDGTNVNLDATNNKGSGATTQSAMNWAKTASDNAKNPLAGTPVTSIYTIHFGNASSDGSYNPAPRDFIAGLASGSFPISGHQPGSQNNAGTSMTQSVIDAENNDGDNFYISPTSAAMAGVFTDIGRKVCPAAAAATQGTLNVTVQVVNANSSGTAGPSAFSVSVTNSTTSIAPVSQTTSTDGNSITYVYPGFSTGNSVTVTPGTLSGYYSPLAVNCPTSATNIPNGQTVYCTLVYSDIPPVPTPVAAPPPQTSIGIGGWQENP